MKRDAQDKRLKTKAEDKKKPGLTIEEAPKQEGAFVVPGERLWLTKDRDRLVPEGNQAAAFLYCTATSRVPRGEYERLTADADAS